MRLQVRFRSDGVVHTTTHTDLSRLAGDSEFAHKRGHRRSARVLKRMSHRAEAVGDVTELEQDFRLLSIPLRPGPFLQELLGKNHRRMSVFRCRSARPGAGSNRMRVVTKREASG